MGERLPCKQEVTSSTLVFSTWQKQRSADAVTIKYSSLAQSVEHSAVNRSVVGSSPTGGAELNSENALFTGLLGIFLSLCFKNGAEMGQII